MLQLVPVDEYISQPRFAEICAKGGRGSARWIARALYPVLLLDLYLLKVELHFISFASSIKPGT